MFTDVQYEYRTNMKSIVLSKPFHASFLGEYCEYLKIVGPELCSSVDTTNISIWSSHLLLGQLDL